MIAILSEKIHDGRFLRLMRHMLEAGYLEDWTWNATLSGVPQGGVVSPALSNIYLHKVDEYVETVLIPQHTRGRGRKRNPAYDVVKAHAAQARQRVAPRSVRHAAVYIHAGHADRRCARGAQQMKRVGLSPSRFRRYAATHRYQTKAEIRKLAPDRRLAS